MTRTTDPDPEPWRPLGEKVDRRAPQPPKPWTKPQGEYGIVQDENGRFRTTKQPPLIPPKTP